MAINPADTLQAIRQVVTDPALPRIVDRLNQLHLLEQAPGAPQPGIGLYRLEQPLAYYAWYRQHKWALPVGLLLLFGIPFALGYAAGRR